MPIRDPAGRLPFLLEPLDVEHLLSFLFGKHSTHGAAALIMDGRFWPRYRKKVVDHAPWAPRMWTISKVYDGRMWLIGGYDNVNSTNLGDVWTSADGVEWQQFVSEPQWKARHESTCYVFDGSLWVVAGNTWPVVNDVWRLTLPQAVASQDRPSKHGAGE